VKLTESKALANYLCVKGRKEEMLGKTPMESLYLEQIYGIVSDMGPEFFKLLRESDDIATYEKLFNEKMFLKFEELNKYLDKKKFIAGDYLTWLDFNLSEFFETA